jgi:hypothetical protein
VLICSSSPYTVKFYRQYLEKVSLDVSKLTRSLAGLDLPLISVGNGEKIVIVVGRVHPGESNSSWVVHGLLKYLQSANAS